MSVPNTNVIYFFKLHYKCTCFRCR